MNYRCLVQQRFEASPYELRPLRQEEMNAIKEWRNAQLDILRQVHPLTEAEQNQYWEGVIKPSFDETRPKQILFAFLCEKQLIGYGGVTHLDWEAGRGEVSFLLDPVRTKDGGGYRRDFFIFLKLLKKVAFQEIHLHRLFTETFDIRPEHIEVLEQVGFQLEGRLKDHVKINGKYVDSLIHGILQ